MNNKLELTWYGKENEIKVEPRLLIENKELSNINDYPETENILIHGDNLLALKAIESKYSGSIKCIYIDPPYNTGSAFEHYDDNLEHSIWLGLMNSRLKILKNLLTEEGSIAVQIDAIELAYLRVLMDEIFGRNNFINIISVKTKIAGVSGSNLGKSLQDNTEFILLYSKNIEKFFLNVVPEKKNELMNYIKEYKETGKSWKYTSVLKEIDSGKYIKSFTAGNGDEIKLYKHDNFSIVSINQIAKEEFDGDLKEAHYKYIDKIFRTTNAQTSIRTKVIEETKEFNNEGLFSIEYTPTKGKNAGKSTRFYYKDDNLIAWLKDVVSIDKGIIFKLDKIGNIWDDIQYNNLTKEGDVQFPNGKKPEALVGRIIDMLSMPGDFVLDSFLGSGTTAAVAHKMNRKYIGIEMGDHAYTHCKVRLDRVIDGSDKGGITTIANWQGGGSYRFYELAPSLILKDDFDEEIINPVYNPDMLASAIALHEGYNYAPDDSVFWKQAKGNEKSFLFVTTRHVTQNYVDSIFSTMKNDEFLIIACKSFDKGIEKSYQNIKIKKIPQMLLDSCEFSKDNYNLNIINPPIYDYEEDCENE